MKRHLVLATHALVIAAACPGTPTKREDPNPFRDEWRTVIDKAVLPGACPEGDVGCPCTNTCEAQCIETPEGDFCVDPGGPAGEAGSICGEGDTCKPGLLCTNLTPQPDVFVCVDPPGDEVTSLAIGGTEVEQNFINRGDIEVFFTGDPGEITVQFRRFTFAEDEEKAQEAFDKMRAWAYSAAIAPPGPDIAEEDCSLAFRSGCEIRAWYEGQIQPSRDGTDIRVILPPNYLGNLDIVTQDNAEEEEYPDRGDVRVKGLPGTATIEVESGRVEVELAADMLEAPACGPELNQSCWDYQDMDMQPAPWDTKCGCTDFGKVKVTTRANQAAKITVEIPDDLWAIARMENAQPSQSTDDEVFCTAEATCDALECEDIDYDDTKPWKHTIEFSDPGPSAYEGTGYGLDLTSEACGMVPFVSGPDDFGADSPESEKRGDVRVCDDCLDIPAP